MEGVKLIRFILVIITICQNVNHSVANSEAKSNYAKLTKSNAKFLLTSTFVGDVEKFWSTKKIRKQMNPSFDSDCLHLDVLIPEMYDPLILCLKKQNLTKSVFHKDFRIHVERKANTTKTLQLDSLAQSGIIVVNGYVNAHGNGVSYISGYIKDQNFYGTIIFSHMIGERILMCSLTPRTLSNLETYLNVTGMEDEEIEEILVSKTAKLPHGQVANAIVSCGDMHRDDEIDIPNQFLPYGLPKPTNVKRPSVKKELRVKKSKLAKKRRKRQDAPSPFGDAPDPFGAEEPLTMSTAVGENKTGKVVKPEKFLGKLFNKGKNGTYYATVCYILDMNYLERRFNGSPEEASAVLGGFVDLTDWILRSTDFNGDGVPDNIGIRLLEVSNHFIKADLMQTGDKWGREPGGKFMKRNDAFTLIRDLGDTKYMSKSCDIKSGIGEINSGKYALYERGGCHACSTTKLTSFTNPYDNRLSQRGELMRMLHHQVRLLVLGFVSETSICANCTHVGSSRSSRVGSFDARKASRGACIVEGDSSQRSNTPLNSFRLSTCSISEGVKCFQKIAGRPNCLSFEKEESYCGNGIIEGDEECDCGTLDTCVEQRCKCSPRTGLNPCRMISKAESELCFSLIKCRGFRFLYELGRSNSTQFITNLPDLLYTGRPEFLSNELNGDSGGGFGPWLSVQLEFLVIILLYYQS